MNNTVTLSLLRKPLQAFLEELSKCYYVTDKDLYTTARMSHHTFNQFFMGSDSKETYERILAVSLLFIYQRRKKSSLFEEDYDYLLTRFLKVAGGYGQVFITFTIPQLEQYLQEAYIRSCTRFKSNG